MRIRFDLATKQEEPKLLSCAGLLPWVPSPFKPNLENERNRSLLPLQDVLPSLKPIHIYLQNQFFRLNNRPKGPYACPSVPG